MVLWGRPPGGQRNPWRGGGALKNASTCYDLMASRIAVAIADSLIAHSAPFCGMGQLIDLDLEVGYLLMRIEHPMPCWG